MTQHDSFWVQILKAKYKIHETGLPTTINTRYGFALWKAMGKVWSDTRREIQWVIFNGRMVKFWFDKWVDGNDPLIFMATHNVPIDCVDRTVSIYILANGEWDWNQLLNYLPPQVVLKIAAIKPPSTGGDSDFAL